MAETCDDFYFHAGPCLVLFPLLFDPPRSPRHVYAGGTIRMSPLFGPGGTETHKKEHDISAEWGRVCQGTYDTKESKLHAFYMKQVKMFQGASVSHRF